MAITATTIIFVVEAAVKLGSKVYDVAVDETAARPLFLPPAKTLPGYDATEARDFFRRHRWLILEGGAYDHLSLGDDDQKFIDAYAEIWAVEKVFPETVEDNGVSINIALSELNQYRQFMEGEGERSSLQRIAGTIVEIGIDYFATNPSALTKDSVARDVLSSFFDGIKDIEIAEGDPKEIAGDFLQAGLGVFSEHSSLLVGDKKLQPLLGGVCDALLEDYDKLDTSASVATKEGRKRFFRSFASTLLRGAGTAIAENPESWISDDNTQLMVKTAMGEVLEGLAAYEDDYFSRKTLEVIVQSSFSAVSQHSDLFGDNAIVKGIIKNVGATLSTTAIADYGQETIGEILAISVEVVGENAPSFIGGDREKLMEAAALVTANQVAVLLRANDIASLFTGKKVGDLFRLLLLEVAKDPQMLIGDTDPASAKSVLAQVVAAVASSLGTTPPALVDDRFVRELVYVCLRIVVRNSEKLLGPDDLDPGEKLVCKALSAYLGVLFASETLPTWPREVFIEGADDFLEAISTHLTDEADLGDAGFAVQAVLDFSRTALKGKVNGSNFALVMSQAVIVALKQEDGDPEITAELVESFT